KKLLPNLKRHHDFFESGITRALSSAIDRAFDLANSILDSGERVRHREAQIVMTMCAQNGLIDVLHTAANILDEQTIFLRHAIPHSIGKIDRRGAGADDPPADFP